MHETPDGFLVCVGVPIARTGEMLYADGETPVEAGPDGTVVIEREEKEVFRDETIASFEGKPITIMHPDDFVDPSNWGELAQGTMQNVRRGDGDEEECLIADLMVMAEDAIQKIKNGLREVSCGYDCEYVQIEPGRGLQRKIVGNHLALVDEGRAGSSFAVKDHIGKGFDMSAKLKASITGLFTKAQKDALAAIDAGLKPAPTAVRARTGDKGKTGDQQGVITYDDVMAAVKDIGAKVDALGKGKAPAADDYGAGSGGTDLPVQDDDDVGTGGELSMEDRMKKLEAAVSKLLERETNEDDVPVDEEADDLETSDAASDDDDGEETEDAMPESTLTGDAKARIEILAPGLKARGADAKMQAVRACYGTKEGKKVIHQLTGDRAPNLKSAKAVDTLFVAASEILKAKRGTGLEGTRGYRETTDEGMVNMSKGLTAEEVNKKNAEFYGKKTG